MNEAAAVAEGAAALPEAISVTTSSPSASS
jgi:hypothetical protein